MATLRDIKRRIAGVKSTQKITKAMKMVATAKMRRAKENIMQARPYAQKMAEMLHDVTAAVDPARFPLLAPREINAVAIVVVTADRGMCGAFNSNIFKAVTALTYPKYNQFNAQFSLRVNRGGNKEF